MNTTPAPISYETAVQEELTRVAGNYAPLKLVVERAVGSRLIVTGDDNKQRLMIDGMACYGAANFGHGHPQITAAMERAIALPTGDLLGDFNALNPGDEVPAELFTGIAAKSSVSRGIMNSDLGRFAEALCDLTGLDQIIPSNGGVDAVETALKAARQWAYKREDNPIPANQAQVIVMEQNFHGRTTTVSGFSSDAGSRDNFGPYAENAFIAVPFGDAEALQKAIEDNPNVAAVLMEPIQGEGGVVIPPEGYIKAVYDACKSNNVLFILDEIQSGMGRTGKNFAFQHELPDGEVPDGLILGKALGGGAIPVSAFISTNEVMNLFEPGSHGSTFGGNPLASIVGLEAIRVLEAEQFAGQSHAKGEYVADKIADLARTDAFSEVRQRGLWLGLEIDPAKGSADDFCKRMAFDHSVFCKSSGKNAVRLSPALNIDQRDLDHIIQAVHDTALEMGLVTRAELQAAAEAGLVGGASLVGPI